MAGQSFADKKEKLLAARTFPIINATLLISQEIRIKKPRIRRASHAFTGL